jgi:hypothetical protein
VAINSLGGSPTSQLSESQLDSNLKYIFSTDFTLPAANFLTSSWVANGWNPNDYPTFVFQLVTWLNNNFERQNVNVNFTDVNLVITQGNVQNDVNPYTIVLMYFGNQGTLAIADGGNFVGDTFTLDIDGGPFTGAFFVEDVDGGTFT